MTEMFQVVAEGYYDAEDDVTLFLCDECGTYQIPHIMSGDYVCCDTCFEEAEKAANAQVVPDDHIESWYKANDPEDDYDPDWMEKFLDEEPFFQCKAGYDIHQAYKNIGQICPYCGK